MLCCVVVPLSWLLSLIPTLMIDSSDAENLATAGDLATSGDFFQLQIRNSEKMVFLEVEMPWNVLIAPDQLDSNGLMLRKNIILRLLADFADRVATKEHGYFIAASTLESIGVGKVRELSGDVLFPVVFKCVTFKPSKGELLVGVVDKILKQGLFLKSGPLEGIFLPAVTMGDYEYVPGDNAMFLSEKHPKLEKDSMVRFRVIGTKWNEQKREFQVLASLAGDFLGSVS